MTSSSQWFRSKWPLWAALFVWLLVLGLFVERVYEINGTFVYGLDDAYIHMAIAKNFAEHAVWGVTPEGFTSSSSSLLWTLLLSLDYRLLGAGELAPLLLNALYGCALIAVAFQLLVRAGLSLAACFATLLGVIFFTPLPTLAVAGMEHILHGATALAFMLFFREWTERPGKRLAVCVAVCAALMVMSRYEGLFFVASASLLLWVRNRRQDALVLSGAAGLPVVLYGLISMALGWYPLPNSVLLKALPPGVSGLDRLVEFSRQFPTALANNGHLLVLVACALAVLLFVRREGTLARAHGGITALLWVFVGGTLLHLLLAKTGWFFRYEAYLVTVGLTVCAAALKLFPWPESRARRAAWVLLALVLATPLACRAVLALGQTPGATRNTHQQQHQTALFLKQYYKGRAVGLNDIGFPSYLSEVRLLDLWGLASMEVAKLKRDGKYQREALRTLATSHRLEIAAVYDEWFGESIPREWVRVAKWRTVGSNVVLGSTEVSFYAVSPEQAAELKANLMSFSSQLPKGVAVKW